MEDNPKTSADDMTDEEAPFTVPKKKRKQRVPRRGEMGSHHLNIRSPLPPGAFEVPGPSPQGSAVEEVTSSFLTDPSPASPQFIPDSDDVLNLHSFSHQSFRASPTIRRLELEDPSPSFYQESHHLNIRSPLPPGAFEVPGPSPQGSAVDEQVTPSFLTDPSLASPQFIPDSVDVLNELSLFASPTIPRLELQELSPGFYQKHKYPWFGNPLPPGAFEVTGPLLQRNTMDKETPNLSSRELPLSMYELDTVHQLNQEMDSHSPSTSSSKVLPAVRVTEIPITDFSPEIQQQESHAVYWYRVPHAGLFQCSVTGLVFGMEGEGELTYRTVSWDRKLENSGKRPAGPLFDIDCPQKSVRQLHLPHCHILPTDGCDSLAVAHVTDDSIEYFPPHQMTNTHVIINITGFSLYGNVDDDTFALPIYALILLFYQPPVIPPNEALINVFWFPSNVVVREIKEKRKIEYGDREVFIETTSLCKLTPGEKYVFYTDHDVEIPIEIIPKDAEFMNFDTYENIIPTFQLVLQNFEKIFRVFLREKEKDDPVWYGFVRPSALIKETLLTVSTVAPLVEAPPSISEVDFVVKHKTELVQRLTGVKSLLDSLQDSKVLMEEQRADVDSERTPSNKNRALLDMVIKKGSKAKQRFYQILKDNDPYLVEDLESKQSLPNNK